MNKAEAAREATAAVDNQAREFARRWAIVSARVRGYSSGVGKRTYPSACLHIATAHCWLCCRGGHDLCPAWWREARLRAVPATPVDGKGESSRES